MDMTTSKRAEPKTKTRKRSGRGGARPGAGRPRGSKAKKMAVKTAIELAHKDGESPLAYLLRVMRSDDSDLDALEAAGEIDIVTKLRLKAERDRRRDSAAQAAAPFVHPKLSSVEYQDDSDRPTQHEHIVMFVQADGGQRHTHADRALPELKNNHSPLDINQTPLVGVPASIAVERER